VDSGVNEGGKKGGGDKGAKKGGGLLGMLGLGGKGGGGGAGEAGGDGKGGEEVPADAFANFSFVKNNNEGAESKA
jgi:hypothetical protein